MKDIILKYALQNAIKYGEAHPKNIVGKVMGEVPEARKDPKNTMKSIQDVCNDVNKLSKEEQTKKIKKLAPELLEVKHEKKTGLPELKNVKGKVVMRFAPSPSGPMHIGHAYVLSLNSEYCRKYNGECILRIEDTNPSNIYPQAYELLEKDGKFLTKDNLSKVVVQSDRLGMYYDWAEKCVDTGIGYVCTCDADSFRELKAKGIACPCRELPKEEHHLRYAKMFSEYRPGEAVLRIKTDIKHKNPALRDWPAMRINDHKHPRQGTEYKVWPLMNFSVAVDDHELGVTHTIRAKDHLDNEKKQTYLFEHFGWEKPTHVYVGRINFENMPISASETRRAIEEGKFEGWDDIRLPFMRALRRRGYQPDAFIRWSLDVGVTQNDKTVTKEQYFTAVNHFNKEVLEPISHRYFFVDEPVKIKIQGAPEQSIELDLHPENKKGGRKFKVGDTFFITRQDFGSLEEGKLYRLMDCLNFTKKKDKLEFVSKSYEEYKDKGAKIIHWVTDDSCKVKVKMPDGSYRQGLGETLIKKLKKCNIVQFERFGFVHLDNIGNEEIEFWFTHK